MKTTRMRLTKGFLALVTTVLFLTFLAAAASAEEKKSPSLTLESEDGSQSITFGLTVQLLYQYDELDKGPDANKEYLSTIRWRRVRPSLSGKLLGDDLSFYFQLSTAPGAIEFMDFYLDYRFLPNLIVRAGQYKIPFTRFRTNSYKTLNFVDWPIITKYFGSERQIGLTFHNGFEKPQPVEYELGVFGGQNARKSHGIGIATVFGEDPINRSDLVTGEPYDEFHPAVVAHLAYNYGGINVQQDTDFEKGGPRFSVGAGGVWDASPRYFREFALRLAPEFLFKAFGWSAYGAYYLGFYEQDGNLDGLTAGLNGVIGQTSYLIGKSVEVSFRYANVGTTMALRHDSLERGEKLAQAIVDAADPDDEEAIAAAEEEADALFRKIRKAAALEREEEYTFGLIFHLVPKQVKLSNDFSLLDHIVDVDEQDFRRDLRFRSQLQFAF